MKQVEISTCMLAGQPQTAANLNPLLQQLTTRGPVPFNILVLENQTGKRKIGIRLKNWDIQIDVNGRQS